MGIIASLLPPMFEQGYPPNPVWTVDAIPELAGKVVIVTGGYTGVGKETVKALLNKNAKVYIAGRSQSKAEPAIKDLQSATGKEALFLNLDLANLKSVKAAAAEFTSKETRLDILFNNGGVMMCPIEQITTDGYDLQFGTNVVGHYYFTKLLLPLLLETAKISPDKHSRVVNTASSGSYAGKLDFATFKDGPARRKVSTSNLYFQSKLANAVFSSELAKLYGDQGIVSTALNPGNLATELTRHISGPLKFIDTYVVPKYPASWGALTQLWAGTAPEGLEFNGKFLIPWARLPKAGSSASLPAANDPKLGKELWTWLEEQVTNV